MQSGRRSHLAAMHRLDADEAIGGEHLALTRTCAPDPSRASHLRAGSPLGQSVERYPNQSLSPAGRPRPPEREAP
jgi:hypothetical protein